MFIVFGRKIPWFDGMTMPSANAGPQMVTAAVSSSDSNSNSQNSNSNGVNEVDVGGKSSNRNSNSNRRSRSRRDEEFDSAVQLQRSYYNPRNSPSISDEVGLSVS